MIYLRTALVLTAVLIPIRLAAQLPVVALKAEASFAPSPGSLPAGRSFRAATAPDISFRNSDARPLLTFHPALADSSARHKSPVLAWFLSWLVTGGGQAYNGQWAKAAAFFVPAALGFGLVMSNDGFSCTSDCGTRDVGLGILVAASVGSQIEAPIAASKINREARTKVTPQVSLTFASIRF